MNAKMYVCAKFESDICIPSYFAKTITQRPTRLSVAFIDV